MTRQGHAIAHAFEKNRPLLADVTLLLGLFALLYALARVGAGFFVAFNPPNDLPKVSLDVHNLPYYAARSTLRMFIALLLSLVFTLAYGYAAAKNRYAERLLVPMLDILQSVPVLGFLSVTVTGFIAMFPGSLFGLECASIFAIFTSQAWNMTFSFYSSLTTLPRELDEAAKVFRLAPWRRFWTLEVPSSMIGLVWNAMMSFGGGWFFVAASEAISVLNKQYTLPGIGSYVAEAVAQQNLRALGWAILTMVIVIVLVDQLFWRPVVAWSQKFRMDKSGGGELASSWVLNLIQAARLPHRLEALLEKVRGRPRRPSYTAKLNFDPLEAWLVARAKRKFRFRVNGDIIFGVVIGAAVVAGVYLGAKFVTSEVRLGEIAVAFGLGLLTLIRVLALVALSTVIWTPIGVAIGFSPKLAKVLQPVIQILASFPANFLFPAATILFIRLGLRLDWGCGLLMALGAQWYILFNAIAGAMAVPTDLREMAANMRLPRKALWTKLIIPSIFPAWVTGAVTASGGAWNASIVSEIVSWGHTTLTARGLGAYIANATTVGDWPRIVLGVALMCLFVVSVNRLLWRRLYRLAQSRYRLG